MVKQFLLIIGFLCSIQVMSQTGIGTTTPHVSAKLDVTSTNKGFLPPRVTLSSVTDATTIPTPATGLLVYNLGSEGLKAGYYYWNGSNWATIATASSPDQTLDYVSVQSSGQTVVTGNTIMYNTTLSGNIPYNSSTGNFSLIAGKTYRLTAYATLDVSSSAGAELNFVWRNAANAELGNYALLLAANSTITAAGQGIVDVIYTPTTNTTVSVYVNWAGGTVALRGGYTYATIQQIGSSATINPWILSGTTTYNTTGNVGIGNNSPTSRLNIAGGGIKIHNGFANNTARPSLTTTAIGSYEIRGVGSIEGSTQVDAGNDGFLRLSAGGGTNTTAQSSIDLSGFSSQSDMNNNIVMRTAGVERLRIDNSGNMNVNGKLNVTDPSGGVAMQAAGFVNHSVPLTLGDIQVQMAPAGESRSLQIRTTGTSFSGMVSAYTTYNGASGSNAFTFFSDVTQTINSTFAHLGVSWGFAQSGDVANYFLRDTTNQRFYRITLMVGASWNNNFISIERLF